MFPSHFCYYISFLCCFRYVSDDIFPIFKTLDCMVNVSEILPLEKIEVYKGMRNFYQEVAKQIYVSLHYI